MQSDNFEFFFTACLTFGKLKMITSPDKNQRSCLTILSKRMAIVICFYRFICTSTGTKIIKWLYCATKIFTLNVLNMGIQFFFSTVTDIIKAVETVLLSSKN
jgi:hypothetical protein